MKRLITLAMAAASLSLAAQPIQLTVERGENRVRLGLLGETGSAYQLEGAGSISSPSLWAPLLRVTLTNASQAWIDNGTAGVSSRFYRLLRLPGAPLVRAENFRLIDHQGSSHELSYQLTARAVVLIFTRNGCSWISQAWPAIRSLRDRYAAQGVVFWMVNSYPEDTRASIAAEAQALGIDLPILQDRGELVAFAYRARIAPEAVLIDMQTGTVFYQGAIEDGSGGGTAASAEGYLESALAQLTADLPASVHWSKAQGCEAGTDAGPPVSYSARIAPLLLDKCVACHSPGNIAPWSMTNHAVVRQYAVAIKHEVLSQRMPPWHADPEYGVFTNEVSLSPEEAALLIRWIEEGALSGEGPDPLTMAAPSTNYPYAWPAELGAPDAVYRIPRQAIPATGEVDYRYFDVPTSLGSDVWVQAAVVRPGNAKVVHHCLVYFGANSLLMGLDGFFAGYVPGSGATAFPADTGKLLPRDTVLKVQMHYTPTGAPESDQTEIGLYLAPAPPRYTLQTRSAANVFFTIPPHASDHPVTAQYTFRVNALLYELSPHMHYRGSRFMFEAFYPDGTREVLLSVPKYYFDWQTMYRFEEPKFLPAGTRLVCTGAWDNSARNPENPNPNATIRFGEQSDDEMFIGYFNFADAP